MAKAKPNAAGKAGKKTQVLDTQAAVSAAKVPEGFKAKRVVTLPTIVIKEAGTARILKIVDAFRVSKVEGKPMADGTKQKPATVCTATDMQTGEMGIFIVSAVVQSNLERDYPEESYVGKAFHISNLGKRKDTQKYNDFSITEVEAE